MGQVTDVLVIGGGPAGLAAAIAARKKGLSVAVADGASPPVDKACGEGLMPSALAALRSLDIKIHPRDGQVFHGVRFLDGSTYSEARFPGSPGIGVRRTVLHQKLADRAQDCGVSLLWNTPVSALSPGGAILGGRELAAKWIVAADGLRSRVRTWCGLDSNSPQKIRFARRRHYRVKPWTDCMEVYWGVRAQAYVTPLSNSETCVVLISREPRLHFEEACREFPALVGSLSNAERIGSERGAVTAMRTLNRVYQGNIALIGDASGSVDAITGEGLGLGFRQALALADALKAGNLRSYDAAHRRFSRHPNFMARLLLLLDRNASLRRRVLELLSREPQLFARLLAMHVGKSSPLRIATTGLRFGWQFLTA